VRGDADLGDRMHSVGADLDLERLAVQGDNGGVQALVKVRLRDGDVVVELAGDGMPH